MDIFGKRRIDELEKQLELAIAEISSLKSDLRELERENYELKSKYEPSKGPAIVKSADPSFMRPDDRINAKKLSSSSISQESPQITGQSSSSDGFVTGAVIGAAVAFTLSDDSGCEAGSVPSDCSSE